MWRMRKRWKWLVGGVAVLVVLAIAGPFVYIHFIEGPAPAKLSLPASHATTTSTSSGTSGTSSTSSTSSTVNGTYQVGSGSEAGYRVSEVLVGQHATAVGRTSKIWGSVSIANDTVTSGSFGVDMASVVSDQSQRNAQFDGRIMDVTQYPTATLTLTAPIVLGSVPPVGAKATYAASGILDMHGVSRAVRFSLSTERTSNGIYALADLPIVFAQWNIANPSVGGFVTTADSGTLEVLVYLTTGAGNPVVSGSGSSSGEGGGGGGGGPVTVPSTTVPKITIPDG
jgi:polyisoprenoid-binding protein YceI